MEQYQCIPQIKRVDLVVSTRVLYDNKMASLSRTGLHCHATSVIRRLQNLNRVGVKSQRISFHICNRLYLQRWLRYLLFSRWDVPAAITEIVFTA